MRSWFVREQSGRTRVLVAAAIGAAAAFVVAWFAPWQLTVLVGWDVMALTVVASVWSTSGDSRPTRREEFARREDNTRTGTHLLLLGAALVSLVGVVLGFLKANQGAHTDEALIEGIGVLTIAAARGCWCTPCSRSGTRTSTTRDPVGGIDFKSKGVERPDYRDFAYTAFTVGMTFQVSDTDITSRLMRRQPCCATRCSRSCSGP